MLRVRKIEYKEIRFRGMSLRSAAIASDKVCYRRQSHVRFIPNVQHSAKETPGLAWGFIRLSRGARHDRSSHYTESISIHLYPSLPLWAIDVLPRLRETAPTMIRILGAAAVVLPVVSLQPASAAKKQIDCLLVDIHLDGLSGIELRHRLKTSHPALPVIFMTGLDDNATRRRALEAGCMAFLYKPFSAWR